MRNLICVPRCVKALLAVVVGAVLTLGAARAQQIQPDPTDHKGQFDIYALGQYLTGGRIISAAGPGFGLGYNFTDRLSFDIEGYAGDLDVKINNHDGVGTTYDATADIEYKFTTGRWSPYVTGGLGIFNYDARDREVDPQFYDTASTGIMYGGGVGVYWTITKHWFFKGAFRVWGTTVKGISVLYGPTLSAGFNF